MEPSRKFFLGISKCQSWRDFLNFLGWSLGPLKAQSMKICSEPPKNRTQLTFLTIKIVIYVGWSLFLFLRVELILKTCASTAGMSWNPLENFFKQLKVKVLTRFYYYFGKNWRIFSIIATKLTQIHCEPPKNRTQLTFLALKIEPSVIRLPRLFLSRYDT